MTGPRFLSLVLLLTSFSLFVERTGSTPEDPLFSYDFLYNEGVEKYLAEDWGGCVSKMEDALRDWHWWKDNVAKCREDCRNQKDEAPLFSENLLDEDKFYEGTVRKTLCLVKCKKNMFGSRMDRVVEHHVDDDFEMKKPYDYLQLCYFKLGKFKEAADAAATVLVAQPNHEVMLNNLKYYISEGDLDKDDIANREMKEYGKEYILGSMAYNNEDYKGTIEHMERALQLYYVADTDCRRLCENSFEQKILQDFVLTVANQYTFTLRCKRNCDRAHGNLMGETVDNFYASFFHYLQYAYYQENDFESACAAIASALHVEPDDSVQLRNKQYYLSNEDLSEDMFVPRESVVAYKERLDYENNLMDYIETSFLFLNDDVMEDVDLDDFSDDVTKTVLENESLSSNASLLGESSDINNVVLSPSELLNEEL